MFGYKVIITFQWGKNHTYTYCTSLTSSIVEICSKTSDPFVLCAKSLQSCLTLCDPL